MQVRQHRRRSPPLIIKARCRRAGIGVDQRQDIAQPGDPLSVAGIAHALAHRIDELAAHRCAGLWGDRIVGEQGAKGPALAPREGRVVARGQQCREEIHAALYRGAATP